MAEDKASSISGLVESSEPFQASPVATERRRPGRPRKEAAEPKQRRVAQRDTLAHLADDCPLWCAPDGEAYASIPIGEHRENWRLKSDRFKRFLSLRSYTEAGVAPGSQALEDAVRVLGAKAELEGERQAPWCRVGERAGKHYLDLCDDQWRVVEVDANGWRVKPGAGLPFVRFKAMRPLPVPRNGVLDELGRFVNAGEDDFALIVAWLVMTLRSRGPYPVLVVNGEQGSGKSNLCARLRSIVDPSLAMVRNAPADEQNLFVSCMNNHVIALDNLSGISSWLSDGLCRVSTGAGFSTRQLFTDGEENVFSGARPILLNGIPALTERPDLAERSITVHLHRISEEARRAEGELEREWNEALPRILGVILDGAASAIRREREVSIPRLPRMADFVLWASAAEDGLGLESGRVATAYQASQKDAAEASFEANPVLVELVRLIQDEHAVNGWEGTATDLLASLTTRAGDKARSKWWPASAQALSNALKRSAPLLRTRGLDVHWRKSGSRTVRIFPNPKGTKGAPFHD